MGTVARRPSLDDSSSRLLDTLCDRARREIIRYFESGRGGTSATFDELVTHLVEQLPERGRESVSASLTHVHLPKLQSRGWLDVDRRSETVEYHGHEAAREQLGVVTEMFAE